MTNGEDIVVRLYAKPIPTSLKRLPSFDMKTKKPAKSPFVRSDVCVLPPLAVIAETVLAWELLQCLVEKFGGDTMDEIKSRYDAYAGYLATRGVQ